MPEIHFDASGMEALTRHLEESVLKVRVETDMAMPEIGAMVAATASEIVKPHSKSIKVSDASVPGLATVRGKAPNSPLARLYEKGGSKGHTKRGKQRFAGGSKTFSHPVFGSQTTPWVEEKRWPFLRPAATKLRKPINARMVKALEDGISPIVKR